MNISKLQYQSNKQKPNPIKFIDPSGKDIWQLDDRGYFTLVEKTDDEFDTILGRENASIQVEKGFLNPFLTESNSAIKDAKSTFYKTSSQNNGKDYFEFFSINSNVEWSIYYTTDNEAYLATSNLINGDYSVGFLLSNHQDIVDKVVRYDHGHTSESIPSDTDFSTAALFPKGGENVSFNIFFIPEKEYYPFTKDTYELRELIVVGKWPHNN